MTVSFHKYGEYFPGTGELRVRPRKLVITLPLFTISKHVGCRRHEGQILCPQLPAQRWYIGRELQVGL